MQKLMECLFLYQKLNNLGSPAGVETFINKCYERVQSKPTFHQLNFCWKWKDYIHPCLRDLSGHQKHRAFKFVSDENDKPKMWYKESPLDLQWQGYSGIDGLDIMERIPEGVVEVMYPKTIALSSYNVL